MIALWLHMRSRLPPSGRSRFQMPVSVWDFVASIHFKCCGKTRPGLCLAESVPMPNPGHNCPSGQHALAPALALPPAGRQPTGGGSLDEQAIEDGLLHGAPPGLMRIREATQQTALKTFRIWARAGGVTGALRAAAVHITLALSSCRATKLLPNDFKLSVQDLLSDDLLVELAHTGLGNFRYQGHCVRQPEPGEFRCQMPAYLLQ